MHGVNDGHRLEEQPFLQGDAALSSADSLVEQKSQSDARSRGRGRWKVAFAVLLVLTIVTVLVLNAVVIGIGPKSIISHESSGHHDDIHEDEQGGKPAEKPAPNKPTPVPTVVQYKEQLPDAPHVRDLDEYILKPDWNFEAPPMTREYFWTIGNAELNPDGVYRPMLLINNQFPGPLVECNEGDTIVVHVANRGINSTALHFHGMFQNGTNSMDGTVGVTQCPIAPNSDFTYKFEVRGQSGTYWYHAHHSAQAADGVLGPMIVHAKDEKTTLQELDYATDRVVMIQDHYHNTTAELLMDYLQPRRENEEPVPDNALINGRGQRDCKEFPGWRCDSSNTSTYTLDLEKNQRHRLRFINTGAFAEFQVQFDEHPFYITEVDGTDVHPEPFHRLNISPAQRYSVVLETNGTASSTYWMRARMVTHCFARPNDVLQEEIRAIVRYTSANESSPDHEPTSKDWSESIEVICRDLNTSALHPVVHMSAPPANDFVTLRANFMIGDWRLSRGFFNDSTWHHNATNPSLHRLLDAPSNVTALNQPFAINNRVFQPDKDLVMQTRGIRTVDLFINSFDDGSHPFHLHGHKFFVLVEGRRGYPPSAEELPAYLEEHGLTENPLRRDVVTVEGYGWYIIRVVFDNPGLWAFHCHNTWHAESGMLMQFLVRADEVQNWKIDPEQRAMCTRKGVESGMRPDDSIWFGNFD